MRMVCKIAEKKISKDQFAEKCKISTEWVTKDLNKWNYAYFLIHKYVRFLFNLCLWEDRYVEHQDLLWMFLVLSMLCPISKNFIYIVYVKTNGNFNQRISGNVSFNFISFTQKCENMDILENTQSSLVNTFIKKASSIDI